MKVQPGSSHGPGSGTVLVTGASGFIGREVVKSLAQQGANVRAIGRRDDSPVTSSTVNYHPADILTYADILTLMKGVDAVVHLAGRGAPSTGADEVADMYQVNVAGTFNVLQAARESDVRRVVVASSAAVYGRADSGSIAESLPLLPTSPYGHSKVSVEQLCEMFSREHGLETIALRAFSVYGPGESRDARNLMLIPSLISRLQSGQPVVIFGDGSQTRDFVHVRDVADAFIASVHMRIEGYTALNVGTGTGTSIPEIVKHLESVMDREAHVEHHPARLGEVRQSVADVSLARKFGISARIRLEEGIKSAVELA